MRSTRFIAAVIQTSAIVISSVASAQTVRGTVRSDRDGTPLPGAIVVLTRDSARVTATLTGDDGSYQLKAPAPGNYGLRVDVVGYRSATVPAFEVGSSDLSRDVRFTFERVSLPAVAVTATSSCAAVAGETGDAAKLWNEASKALEATRLAQDEGRFTVALTRFERVLSLPDSAVKSTHSSSQSGVSDNPFVSLSPDSIARLGYRVTRQDRDHYYAPDARVLLSDQFVATHCFGTRRGGAPGTLGLSFRPQKSGAHVDVEGVLWLDSTTAELRSLEYRYTSLPRRATGGGTVEFGRLPNGVHGVQRWVIRMPVLEVHESRRRPDGALGRFVDTLVTAVQEEGGEVLAGVAATGRRGGTRLRGTVFDSTRNVTLGGALVTIEGTGLSVHSDTNGAFTFDSLDASGNYRVRFWHARLDSLGIAMPRQTIQIRPGAETTVALAVPGAASIARERCGQVVSSPIHVVSGIVHSGTEAASDVPVVALSAPPASSTSTSPSLQVMSTVTSENGRFALCQLPASAPIWITTLASGTWTTPVLVRDSSTATAIEVRQENSPTVTTVSNPGQRTAIELARVSSSSDETMFYGVVLLDEAIPSVPIQVLVDGQVATTANTLGMFMAQRIPEGGHRITFRAAGFAPVTVLANLKRGESPLLLITPQRATVTTIASASPSAGGSSALAGFEDRRRHGQGYFFGRDQIEKRGAGTLADIIRNVPGVRIVYKDGGNHYETRDGQQLSLGGSGCEMMIYLDGEPYPVNEGYIDDHVRPQLLEAIEVYPAAAQVPRQFAGAKAACGVIVLWLHGQS